MPCPACRSMSLTHPYTSPTHVLTLQSDSRRRSLDHAITLSQKLRVAHPHAESTSAEYRLRIRVESVLSYANYGCYTLYSVIRCYTYLIHCHPSIYYLPAFLRLFHRPLPLLCVYLWSILPVKRG
jgi:hypothetical protein